MKNAVLAILVASGLGLSLSASDAFAQPPARTAPTHGHVTISAKKLSQRAAIKEIAYAAGLQIEHEELLRSDGEYNLAFENESVEKAVQSVLSKTGIEARIDHDKIVLTRK